MPDLPTHTTDPSLPHEDIMARRENDPAALEPIPDFLLSQLSEATQALEQVQREKAAALSRAAASEKAARAALARARAAETLQKSVLAKNDTFTRLFVKSLPHPCVSLEVDQITGRTVAHISVVLNELPERSDYNSRTTFIAGETVLLDCIPWQILTPSGTLPVRLKGSVRLTLSKDSTIDYTETQRTGLLRSSVTPDPVDPDESDRSRSTLFIPSQAGLQTTKDTTGTGGPNAHDLLQSQTERLSDETHRLTESFKKSALAAPPSAATAALHAALEEIRPRALPK